MEARPSTVMVWPLLARAWAAEMGGKGEGTAKACAASTTRPKAMKNMGMVRGMLFIGISPSVITREQEVRFQQCYDVCRDETFRAFVRGIGAAGCAVRWHGRSGVFSARLLHPGVRPGGPALTCRRYVRSGRHAGQLHRGMD